MTVLVVAPTARTGSRWQAMLAQRPTSRTVLARVGVPLARQIQSVEPDVLLLDLGREPVEWAIGELAHTTRRPAVLITDDSDHELGPDALRVGIRALLPRDAPAAQVIAALEAALAGLTVRRAEPLLRGPAPPRVAFGTPPAHLPALTRRETQILSMMAEGLANKLIAQQLGVSGHTVKFHIASIFAKLQAGSRTEAVAIGVRAGLISI